jgi:hypothetical protein
MRLVSSLFRRASETPAIKITHEYAIAETPQGAYICKALSKSR